MENTAASKSAKDLTMVVYALYAASFLVAVTAIAAIIINYLKQGEVAGTYLESHFRWQMRTFWYGLLWAVIGGLTTLVFIGWLVLAADGIWVVYRIVKGWLNLNDDKPMYAD